MNHDGVRGNRFQAFLAGSFLGGLLGFASAWLITFDSFRSAAEYVAVFAFAMGIVAICIPFERFERLFKHMVDFFFSL